MTQLDLLAPCRVPAQGSQCYELLMAMKNGKRLTVARALAEHACYALSQRCGQLRREYGWPIQSRTITTAGGARVSEYWIE
jgi:hypothetical protein